MMNLCEKLQPYLDKELSPWEGWRFRRHLARCEACREAVGRYPAQRELLRRESTLDIAAEAAAIRRVEAGWSAGFAALAAAPRVRAPRRPVRWLTASAAVAGLAAFLVVNALTAPAKAVADVQRAMARVQRFHLRVETSLLPLELEAWGERGRGARVEGRESGRLLVTLVDDGRRLQRHRAGDDVVYVGESQLDELFRHANGLIASRLLTRAAGGRLFRGAEDWMGSATARRVATLQRGGRSQHRIEIDLKDGFFERMVVYAEVSSDRILQANLYTDGNHADTEPFARVYFSYPEEIQPERFHLELPDGVESAPEPLEMGATLRIDPYTD